MKFIVSSLIAFLTGSNLLAQNNIMDHLSSDEKFEIITDLLVATELDQMLRENDYYTLIAPDNDAFLTHFSPSQLDSLKLNGIDELTNLLKHHIIHDFVDINDPNGKNIPLYGDLIDFFIDANGTYRLVSFNTSTKMDEFTDVDNGRVLEAYDSILLNRNESLRENNNLYSYWYHFIIENSIGLQGDIGIIDTILNSNNEITIIGLQDISAVKDYIQENGGVDTGAFVDSLIRRHTLSGLYNLQNIYDGLVVKNWLDEELHFSVIDDTCYINGKEILTHYIYTDASVIRLYYPNDIISPNVISETDENIISPIKFYPNPTYQELNIELPDHYSIKDFVLYNVDGQLVIFEEELKGHVTIDVSNESPGFYFISYRFKGKRYKVKLIKG